MRSNNKAIWVFAGLSLLFSASVFADGEDAACPVGLVNGLTLDEEFGVGSQANTRCITEREEVNVVYNVKQKCKNNSCTKPYAFPNINNVIQDYEITHGMDADDYDLVAVVYGAGYSLILDDESKNEFKSTVVNAINKGVTVYFCQNTARAKGVKFADMIPGVKFVTGGVTALSDFQNLGYSVVTPDGP